MPFRLGFPPAESAGRARAGAGRARAGSVEDAENSLHGKSISIRYALHHTIGFMSMSIGLGLNRLPPGVVRGKIAWGNVAVRAAPFERHGRMGAVPGAADLLQLAGLAVVGVVAAVVPWWRADAAWTGRRSAVSWLVQALARTAQVY